jgi:hypothetical protein
MKLTTECDHVWETVTLNLPRGGKRVTVQQCFVCDAIRKFENFDHVMAEVADPDHRCPSCSPCAKAKGKP